MRFGFIHHQLHIIKRQYARWTPIIQICGFLIMAAFVTGSYFTRNSARADTLATHELRISALESRNQQMSETLARIDQSVDDIKNYLIKPGHL